MLLSDGCPNTVEDLRVYESGILDVAHAENIDLKTKLGLATEEVSEEVLDFLLNKATDPYAFGANVTFFGRRRTLGVTDVFVTRQMVRWHAIHTVALVYRDAFHNQLNTRYQDQYQDYLRLSQEGRDKTLSFGIGIVGSPVPRPGPALLTQIPANVVGATYFVRVSWVDTVGREGTPSEITALDVPDGQTPVVQVGLAPSSVVGFQVYMGLTETTLSRQNSVAIPVGQSFLIGTSALIVGSLPGNGQNPDYYVSGARLLRRG